MFWFISVHFVALHDSSLIIHLIRPLLNMWSPQISPTFHFHEQQGEMYSLHVANWALTHSLYCSETDLSFRMCVFFSILIRINICQQERRKGCWLNEVSARTMIGGQYLMLLLARWLWQLQQFVITFSCPSCFLPHNQVNFTSWNLFFFFYHTLIVFFYPSVIMLLTLFKSTFLAFKGLVLSIIEHISLLLTLKPKVTPTVHICRYTGVFIYLVWFVNVPAINCSLLTTSSHSPVCCSC